MVVDANINVIKKFSRASWNGEDAIGMMHLLNMIGTVGAKS